MRAKMRNFRRLPSLRPERGRAPVQRAVSHEEKRSLTIVGAIVGRMNSMKIIVGTIGGSMAGITDIVLEGTIAGPTGVQTTGDIVPRGIM